MSTHHGYGNNCATDLEKFLPSFGNQRLVLSLENTEKFAYHDQIERCLGNLFSDDVGAPGPYTDIVTVCIPLT